MINNNTTRFIFVRYDTNDSTGSPHVSSQDFGGLLTSSHLFTSSPLLTSSHLFSPLLTSSRLFSPPQITLDWLVVAAGGTQTESKGKKRKKRRKREGK